ncbi:plasmid stability [Prochlorococcus phage P-TIM68]|uniref:Putative plasmid stability protein n=1 Tax=Prochlorococcus phage P-TIM68 TaxID=1542477 RepID=A0A0K0KW25_9CAUD|nr:plasmid stability [Prochlorococcus phage P-TIM68]AIR93552.1 putative plasmid stability protein [Prochlorococcus phage P-TIM68]
MQKIVNAIAIASGVVSLTVVGLGGYVFIRKDAIIESAKERIQNAVLGSITPDLGGLAGDAIPDFTGGAAPLPSAPDAPSAPVSPF